jgi:TRAP-type C4-dicarboxylate transport system permease small subunit
MQRLEHWAFRSLEIIMVLLLAAMTLMVLGNVVLRYVFDSGLVVSEELSRFLFVWLTFIGAVVVARENMHLGVETLVALLGRRGRVLCLVLSDLLTVLCCSIFFWGTWQQADINATFYAPVTGISMLWVYGVGFFSSVGIGLIACMRLLRTATGRLTEAEIAAFAGELTGDAAKLKEQMS